MRLQKIKNSPLKCGLKESFMAKKVNASVYFADRFGGVAEFFVIGGKIVDYRWIREAENNYLGDCASFVGFDLPVDGKFYLQDVCNGDGNCNHCSSLCAHRGETAWRIPRHVAKNAEKEFHEYDF
jgi:hypothetical protein